MSPYESEGKHRSGHEQVSQHGQEPQRKTRKTKIRAHSLAYQRRQRRSGIYHQLNAF